MTILILSIDNTLTILNRIYIKHQLKIGIPQEKEKNFG